MRVGFKKYPWKDIPLLATRSAASTVSSVLPNEMLFQKQNFMQRFTTGDRFSYSLLSCSMENLLPFMGLEGFFITLFKVTAFATAKYDPKEAVASCHEAAVAAFLVALGQIGLVLPCSRTWCWVTAVVQVCEDSSSWWDQRRGCHSRVVAFVCLS